MPAFDYPLAKLQDYRGSSPCPSDHDAYWSAALAELATVQADVVTERVAHPAPYAECHDLWFTGVRGARVYAKYLRPVDATTPHGAVVVFHGYSGYSPDWFSLLPYVAQGFSVLAMDCRGQGGRSQDVGGAHGTTLEGHIVRGLGGDPQDLLFRHVYLDCAQLVRLAMDLPEVDPDRVAVMGASQGGGLTIAAAALEPRVRAAAPQYPFLSDFRRVWTMDLATNAYAELRDWLRRFDPRHEDVDGMFEQLGYLDVANLAPRIRARVLMATGLMDMVCPPSTQFAAYNRITAPKDVVVYPDFEHEPLPQWDDRVLAFLMETIG